MPQRQFDVYGIGNPLIDLLVHIPVDFLDKLELEPNRMYLVHQERQRELIEELKSGQHEVLTAPGGSAANTMSGLALIGSNVAYTGKLGQDELGQLYQQLLEKEGVTTCFGFGEGSSGSSLILVGQDGSRTMNTFLGMCQELHPSDIDAELMQQSNYLYIEGYLWDTKIQQDAVSQAIGLAKQHGTKIALSLSDPFCAQRHQEAFHRLVREDVDLLFCNQEEAFALLDTEISQEALEYLTAHVERVAFTMGARGALVCEQREMFYIDPRRVNVVDTTGAGDAFAAGLLYGLTHEKSVFESGVLATAMAAEVIQRTGPRLDKAIKEKMLGFFSSHN
jgi:sugar/nucleoside kinase (ribokinase family)